VSSGDESAVVDGEADRAERVAVDDVLVTAADVVERARRRPDHGPHGARGEPVRGDEPLGGGLVAGGHHHAVAGDVDIPAVDRLRGGAGRSVECGLDGVQLLFTVSYDDRQRAGGPNRVGVAAVQHADGEPSFGGREPGAGEPVAQPGSQGSFEHRCGCLVCLPDPRLGLVEAEVSLQGLLHRRGRRRGRRRGDRRGGLCGGGSDRERDGKDRRAGQRGESHGMSFGWG
jgi:hypothetical protein